MHLIITAVIGASYWKHLLEGHAFLQQKSLGGPLLESGPYLKTSSNLRKFSFYKHPRRNRT